MNAANTPRHAVVWSLLTLLLVGGSGMPAPTALEANEYDDLVTLFRAWRSFAVPPLVNGVPDYTDAAMTAQHSKLDTWRSRLADIDTTGWSVSNRVDWHLVRAEMNGLDFDHRVKRPWKRDPAFYVFFYPNPTDVPAREGPVINGALETYYYDYPLSDGDAQAIEDGLRAIPALYDQARTNLTGNARDLWVTGIRSIREQSDDLSMYADRMTRDRPAIANAARAAQTASNMFADWLDQQAASKSGSSGVGRDHYSWNLQQVHLLPYTWEEEVLLMKRELARAHAALRLEEHRNRDLPPLERIDSAEEYDRRLNVAVDQYMAFLEEEDILPMKDYMDKALRDRIGRFTPTDGLRGFFSEVGYRDELVMRTHQYHWIELARIREEPNASPIRATPLLFNIYDGRGEGLATAMEEMMMDAGLFDERPLARELVWILLAQRAARALGGLYQHGGLMTLEEATKFADKWTPRGWLPWNGGTIQHEQQLYLRQPAYGTSYVSGKLEIAKLLAEYARQRGDDFVLKTFMDELNGAGVIPVSLVNWQLNGDDSEIRSMVAFGE